MTDPTSPTIPPPAPPSQTLPAPGSDPFFDAMRAALPAAHHLALSESYLAGQLAQEKVDEMTANPTTATVTKAIDDVSSVLSSASAYFDALPEPFRTILKDAAAAVKVADEALAPLGL